MLLGSSAWQCVIGLSGAFHVAIGAAGAHALSSVLSEKELSWIATAVQYHLFHLLVTMLALHFAWKKLALLWFSGAWLFSASLILMALTGSKILGPITPIGGMLMIIAWLGLAISPILRKD